MVHTFLRLQCPSGWEVAKWARWHLTLKMRAQSGISKQHYSWQLLLVITLGGAWMAKHIAQSHKDKGHKVLEIAYIWLNAKVFHMHNIVALL